MYIGYAQFFIVILLFLEAYKETAWGVIVFKHTWISAPVSLALFMIISIVIGFYDKKVVRGLEYKEVTETNPYFMEMRNDVKELMRQMDGIAKKGKDGLKITMLSEIDYAGSGYKIMKAVSDHTNHDITLFSGAPQNSLGHPTKNLVMPDNMAEIQKRIDESDIVHIKGDWPARDGYLGFNIMHKPTVQTVCGSFFRKKGLEEHSFEGWEKWPMSDFKATLKTAFTLDLNYPDYSDIWTPHPTDSSGKPNLWKYRSKPIFIHMPTHRGRKDTPFILKVFKRLQKEIDCEVRLIEGVTYEEAMEQRMEATIFFDQFRVGFYGNSAIEAMQYGIPTACWISDKAIEQGKGKMDGCPVINAPKNVDAWVERVKYIVSEEPYMRAISSVTKEWCDKWHSYESIAEQWDNLYKQLV
jgi:glycosyltransferase involved in cell wall biosynthesis